MKIQENENEHITRPGNEVIRALPYSSQIFIQKQWSVTMTVRDKTSNNSNKRSKEVEWGRYLERYISSKPYITFYLQAV